MQINNLDFRKFYLIPLNDPANYRREVQAHRMREQANKINQDLAAS